MGCNQVRKPKWHHHTRRRLQKSNCKLDQHRDVLDFVSVSRTWLGLCCGNIAVILASKERGSCSRKTQSTACTNSCGISNLHLPLACNPCNCRAICVFLGRHQCHAVHSALRTQPSNGEGFYRV